MYKVWRIITHTKNNKNNNNKNHSNRRSLNLRRDDSSFVGSCEKVRRGQTDRQFHDPGARDFNVYPQLLLQGQI